MFSNAWIASSAAAQVYVGCRLLGEKPNATVCLLAFLSMFWVYTFAKAVHFDPRADEANDPLRTRFLLKHRTLLIALGLGGFAFGVWHCFQSGALALTAFLFPTVAGIFYDLKLLPRSFRYRRLKEIPGVKGLTVALAWGLMPSGLILAAFPSVDRQGLIAFTTWCILVWFFNTTFFDLGDVKGDRLEGTNTLPIVWGYERTRLMLHGINGSLTLVWLLAHQQGHFDPCGEFLWLLGIFHWIILGRAWGEEADLQWECDFFSDGAMLAAAVLVWIGGSA